MMGEIEEMTELPTEQASDLMFVGFAESEGFPTGVKLRCEMKVVEYTIKWLPVKASGKGRDCEPHIPRDRPCPVEIVLEECRDKIKKRNTPKT